MAEIVTIGEALVEIMRTELDMPLDLPGAFQGPFPSGAPAIFADCAARLGASVGFVGSVGADAFGECIRRRLLQDGIDCSALRCLPDRTTGIAFVSYRSDGTRAFLFHLPHSAAACVDLEQIPPGYLEGVRFLHIMGSSLSVSPSLRETCYAAAAQVHKQGGVISLDPNLRAELLPVEQIRAVCEPILSLAKIVLPSGEELRALTGAPSDEIGAQILLARGVEIVALKRGALGSVIYTPKGALEIPPYAVKEVDPTGAGDCYDAAFIVGYSGGWDLYKIGLFANAVGALATTRLGPMEGIFQRAQVLAFMEAQGRPFA